MARDLSTDDADVSEERLRDLIASSPRYEFPYGDDVRERRAQTGKYGVMYAGEYKWSNRKCTREAYGDSRKHSRGRRGIDRNRRSLYFHTTWMTTDPAVECIQEIPEYNRFDPDYAARVLEEFPHPALYTVGRESSVVLYVWTEYPAAFMERVSSIRDAYVADLEPGDGADIFAPAGPDELGAVQSPDTFPGVGVGQPDATDGKAPHLVRCWWD